ncbi:LexA family protein [Serratia quinivorans]|uniref:LexA family protein n=1 Tax=Serratia quinivorans TaxID=137545 RepID=UPI00107ED32A|nr:LexA family transcriptional regulator [Serratia quinivorans]QBX68684.1 LexA family transcriptional regulator [Serratia quinivorans]
MKKKPLSQEQIDDSKRLKALYDAKKKDLGLSQELVASEIGISQSAVAQILSGKNALNLKRASEFAKLLGVSVSDFSPGLAKEAAAITDNNVVYAGEYKKGKSYPLVSWVQAGAWAEALEPYTLSQITEWYEADVRVQGEGFWLRVEGDSMTAPAGISIPEDTLVLFDTGRDPVNGSLVVAKMNDANEATFKKLIIDGGQKYLKGLNPAWPLMPINGDCKIIGVAIQTMMRLV